GCLGERSYQRTDVRARVDRGVTGGMLWAQLEQHVEERAGLEVGAPEPHVENVEEREELFLGIGAEPFGPRLQGLAGPALFAQFQEGNHEIVLRREMPVERRLGDARALDHLVDADSPNTAVREQLVGGFQYAIPDVARRPADGLPGPRHL